MHGGNVRVIDWRIRMARLNARGVALGFRRDPPDALFTPPYQPPSLTSIPVLEILPRTLFGEAGTDGDIPLTKGETVFGEDHPTVSPIWALFALRDSCSVHVETTFGGRSCFLLHLLGQAPEPGGATPVAFENETM